MSVDTERFTVTLPTLDSDESAAQFLTDLEQHMSVRGVTKLHSLVSKIRDHMQVAARQLARAEKTVDYINGIRTYTSEGGKVRSVRNTARKFFDSLNGAAIRQQCKFYNLDYDAFEEVDGRIEALVDRYMEEINK